MPDFNGNNKQGARDLMINRNVYNGYVLTLLDKVVEPTLETNQIKDFLKDEKILYGRLDHLIKNTVFPNSTFLRMFPGSTEQGLNLVVEAFDDMKRRFDEAYRTGQISRDSKALSALTVKKAYISPLREYDKYIEGTKKDFQRYVDNFNRIEEISDFDSFLPVFMDYISLTAKYLPVTRTMFFLTRYMSPRVSGLVFEIYEGDYGDDQLKVDLFYKDRNFEYLKNLAYTYGFMIDKHVPWRLIADLNSPRMTPYIKRNFGGTNPTATTVLTSAFTTTYQDDIYSVINLLVGTYNMFVAANPLTIIKEAGPTASPDSAKTVFANCKKVKTINRTPVNVTEIDLQYGTAYWLGIYARIRNIETSMLYNEGVLQEIINRSIDLANSLDRPTALGYIVSKFDNIEHFEGSLFHDVTRLKMSEDPSATEADVTETVRRSVQASNFIVY